MPDSENPASTSDPTGGRAWVTALFHDPLPVGGVAGALLLGNYALLGISPSGPLLVAGFCGAAFVYGADRGLVDAPEDAINHPGRRRWVNDHRRWLWGEAVILALLGVGALPFLRWETLIGAGIGGLLTGLHLFPVGRWGRLLKRTGMGKPLIVAGAWTLGATVLPVIEAGQFVTVDVGLLAGYRLLFILPNVLVADWGDREGDEAAELQPWTTGGTGAGLRWAATGLLVLAGGVLIALGFTTIPAGLLLVDGVGLVWMGWAVWKLDPTRTFDRFVMDLIVAWPLATALVAYGFGAA